MEPNGAQMESNGAQMEPNGAQWSPMELNWSTNGTEMEAAGSSQEAPWISNRAQMELKGDMARVGHLAPLAPVVPIPLIWTFQKRSSLEAFVCFNLSGAQTDKRSHLDLIH